MQTSPSWLRSAAAIGVGLLLGAGPISAAVELFSGEDALFVAPGGTLEVDLYLAITAGEQVAGIDYYWKAAPEAAGFLTLSGRNIASSPISVLFYENSEVLAAPGNQLDPENAFDLGGLTEEDFVSTGTWLVATFTFEVSPVLAPGTYQLSTFTPVGFGWATPAPGSQIHAFDQQASLFFTVVPEPAVGWYGVAAGTLLLVARRSFRRQTVIGRR